jgi:4-amino-4-deoxy-L-arabinose transferase-like glycosyltransferase
MNTTPVRNLGLWWVLLGLAVASMYLPIGANYPLLDPDEGRYAEIPREMLETGDFVTPRLNYVRYFEKPPLFYWLVAGSFSLLGESAAAARAVPAVLGLLTVALVGGMGTRVLGPREGLIGAWVYATALLPFISARLPVIDGLFTLTLTATWAAWYLGYVEPPGRAKQYWYVAAWASLALAVMAKGPAAILITGLLVFGFVALRRDWAALKSMAWAPGVLVFLAIALPWHVAVSLRNPDFFHYYVVVQNVQRFLGSRPEHVKPAWFYIAILFPGMGAWALFAIPALGGALRQGARKVFRGGAAPLAAQTPVEAPDATKRQSLHPQAAGLYLTVWVLAVVGFFSLSSCKLVPYIWPTYPALALLVSWYLCNGGAGRASVRIAAALMGLAAVGLAFYVSHISVTQDTVPPSRLVAETGMAQIALGLGALLLFASSVRPRWLPVTVGLAWALLIPTVLMALPEVAAHRRSGALLQAMAAPPWPQDVTVAEWGDYNQSIAFYTHRRVVMIDWKDELIFGIDTEGTSPYYLEGGDNLKRLAEDGPLLAAVNRELWPQAREWGLLHPVAYNSGVLFVGNKAFFERMGLQPLPDDVAEDARVLVLPRRATGIEARESAGQE